VERSDRVFAAALARRQERVARGRARRRFVVAVAAAVVVLFVLLRGSSAPAGEETVSVENERVAIGQMEVVAREIRVGEVAFASDAGYARD
jgi:hypothetical protein